MSYPFDQDSALQERAARSRLSLDDLKARLGAYAIAAPHLAARATRCDVIVTGPDGRARACADLEDWTGSFDMHLGVYTSD